MVAEIVDDIITELVKPEEQPKSDDPHFTFDRMGRERYFDCYVPDGYIINSHGVWKRTTHLDRNGELQKEWDIICSTRLMPTGLFNDVDTKKDIIELTFLSHCALETIYVPSVTILGPKEWREHVRANNYGRVDVLDEELKDVRKFIQTAVKANIGQYKGPNGTMFKTGDASARTGWQGNKFEKFVIGSTLYCKNGVEPAVFMDSKNVCVDERLAPKGTLLGWIDAVKPVIMYPKLRFTLYHGIGSLLLGMNKSPNSSFGIIGDTSIGKTFSIMIKASMFGNPDPEGKGLIIPGDLSITAMNAIFTTMTDVPIVIDEIGKMKEEHRNGFTYAIGNGKESIRGTIDGGLRSDRMIRGNATITGEIAAVSEFANNGAQARNFTMNGRVIPVIDGRIVTDTKFGIRDNYGHILPLVLAKIFALGEVKIKKMFRTAIDRLYTTTTDSIMQRKAEYFAIDEVAGELLEDVFRDIGITPMKPTKVVDIMWNECVVGNPDLPLEVRALGDIYRCALSRPRNFLVNDQQPKEDHPDDICGWFVGKQNQYGSIISGSEFEYLDLNQHWAEKFIRDSKYGEPNRMFSYWRDHDITECNVSSNGKMCDDGKKRLVTYAISHYYQFNQSAKKKPIIRIKMSKIKELLETEVADEVKTELASEAW